MISAGGFVLPPGRSGNSDRRGSLRGLLADARYWGPDFGGRSQGLLLNPPLSDAVSSASGQTGA
jgi:hypothetical protein